MIAYYKINGQICFSDRADLPYEKIGEPEGAETLTWLFDREPGSCRASFLVNSQALLSAKEESVSWLNENKLDGKAFEGELPGWGKELIAAGKVRAVNVSHPRFEEILSWKPMEGKSVFMCWPSEMWEVCF